MQKTQYDLSANELIQYLSGFFSFLLRGFQFLFVVARKYVWILLLTALASAFTLYFLQKRGLRRQEFRMSCLNADNDPRIFGEMLRHTNLLLQDGAYGQLAAILRISPEQASQIDYIKGKSLSLGKLEDYYAQNRQPFYIDVGVFDTSFLPVLETRLLEYLNHNDQSERSRNRQRAKWQSRQTFYQGQLAKLDSLKEVIRTSYLSGNNHIDLAQQNNSVVDIYRLSDSMSFFLADVNYYLDHYASVEKIYGFMPVKPRTSALLIKTGIYTAAVVGGLWMLLALVQLVRNNQRQTAAL